MADTKISALADGTAAAATDQVVVARAGANYRLTLTNVWTVPSGSQLLLPDGAVATPSNAFSGATGTGSFRITTNILWSIAGTAHMQIGSATTTGLVVKSDLPIGWSGSTPDAVAPDTKLFRDAANTLALRNAAAQQTFNLYNTFTDTSNYERFAISGTAGSLFSLTAQTAGTGADNLSISLVPAGIGQVLLPLPSNNPPSYPNPSLAFAADPDTGIHRTNANQLQFIVGATNPFVVLPSQFRADSTAKIGWASADSDTSGMDTVLQRDGAANTLALRNSTAAQTFNIYNTYTDATTNEYGGLRWSGTANTLELFTEKGSVGGTARSILIRPDSTRGVSIANENNSSGFTVEPTGGVLGAYFGPVGADNTDFGQPAVPTRNVYLSRSIQGSKSKALTESAATTFVTIAIPQTTLLNFAGGSCIYTIYATDGTDTQAINGEVKFSAINKAGTVTATVADVQAPTAASSGTLTATLSATTSGDNVILQCNAVSSLTQTSLTIYYRLNMPQPNTVTPA